MPAMDFTEIINKLSPQSPNLGPPLPSVWNIFWPWSKEKEQVVNIPPVKPLPGGQLPPTGTIPGTDIPADITRPDPDKAIKIALHSLQWDGPPQVSSVVQAVANLSISIRNLAGSMEAKVMLVDTDDNTIASGSTPFAATGEEQDVRVPLFLPYDGKFRLLVDIKQLGIVLASFDRGTVTVAPHKPIGVPSGRIISIFRIITYRSSDKFKDDPYTVGFEYYWKNTSTVPFTGRISWQGYEARNIPDVAAAADPGQSVQLTQYLTRDEYRGIRMRFYDVRVRLYDNDGNLLDTVYNGQRWASGISRDLRLLTFGEKEIPGWVYIWPGPDALRHVYDDKGGWEWLPPVGG